MRSFKEFVKEATFNINASRSNGLPINRVATNNIVYPVQTGQPAARVTPQQLAPVRTIPAVTKINVPTPVTTAPVQPTATGGKNGQLTPRELKPVGKYNAGPSGARQWYGNTALLSPKAADAFLAAQQSYGQIIPINSAYRNLEHQKGLSREGHRVVGRAGTSRHGLGMAIDVQPNTPAYNWLQRNGRQFGWYFASIPGDPYHFEFRG